MTTWINFVVVLLWCYRAPSVNGFFHVLGEVDEEVGTEAEELGGVLVVGGVVVVAGELDAREAGKGTLPNKLQVLVGPPE